MNDDVQRTDEDEGKDESGDDRKRRKKRPGRNRQITGPRRDR